MLLKAKSINMETFYQKQIIINRLPLPRDIIDNEIKSYVFHDKITGESKKKKQVLNENFKANILSTRSNFFGSQNEIDPHWAIGFINDDENIQLQANNCETCGNYLIFGSMFAFTQSQLMNISCQCLPQGNQVEIMWDEEYLGDDANDYESQTTQDTLIEHYHDEDIIQDTEWDEEYTGN